MIKKEYVVEHYRTYCDACGKEIMDKFYTRLRFCYMDEDYHSGRDFKNYVRVDLCPDCKNAVMAKYSELGKGSENKVFQEFFPSHKEANQDFLLGIESEHSERLIVLMSSS